ncbi:MAG: hypothetical protein BWX84_02372 [Verrucomicrobia bacterium ADurb.Bin118]|nr:MAG: hypothetical protein BWX84_02372 [Verrucomicrobia bacterium ADurb.Bin118]
MRRRIKFHLHLKAAYFRPRRMRECRFQTKGRVGYKIGFSGKNLQGQYAFSKLSPRGLRLGRAESEVQSETLQVPCVPG